MLWKSGRVDSLKQFLLGILSVFVCEAYAAEPPACPDGKTTTIPPFASAGKAPSVASWKKLASLVPSCQVSLQSSADLTTALAGRFNFDGTTEELAERLGAVSETEDLVYWSISNSSWQSLAEKAFALESRDAKIRRTDFSGSEVLSGETLYLAQNDSRSWGLNVFEMKTISTSIDHIVLKSQNRSRIRFGPITVFKPESAVSVLFIHREKENLWTYYSLSVLKDVGVPMSRRSVINRQAALYRHLVGVPLDKDPPVAR